MFVPTCQRLQKRVLLGIESIETIHDTEFGPVAVYRCACGDLELWHRGASYTIDAGINPIGDGRAVARAITPESAVGA